MTSLATCSWRAVVHGITSKHHFGKLFVIENGVYRRIVDYVLIESLIDIHLLKPEVMRYQKLQPMIKYDTWLKSTEPLKKGWCGQIGKHGDNMAHISILLPLRTFRVMRTAHDAVWRQAWRNCVAQLMYSKCIGGWGKTPPMSHR